MNDPSRGIKSLVEGSVMRAIPLDRVLERRHDGSLEKLAFKLTKREPDQSWPPVEDEWIWGKPSNSQQFEIDNIPFFASEFSYGDIVETVSEPDVLQGARVISSIVRHNGHSTYRIRFDDGDTYSNDVKDQIRSYLTSLSALGCGFEVGDFNLVALDADPRVSLEAVVEILARGEKDGVWDWEAGYVASKLERNASNSQS